jgi:hypothetical protein
VRAQNGYALVVVAAVGTLLALAWPVIQTMETTFPQARPLCAATRREPP